MSQRALVFEAHHTTHIEGTQLTLYQSEKAGRLTQTTLPTQNHLILQL